MQTATTTITTTHEQAQALNVSSPQIVLGGLIDAAASPCNHAEAAAQNQEAEMQVNEEIRSLQGEIRQIRSEVVEVQRLLGIRDTLYQDLDSLREERQQIEGEIQACNVVGHSQGNSVGNYHQMNERLRRRIYEIREYIQKMTYENQRIEQGIVSNQYMHQQQDFLHAHKQIVTPVHEPKRYNMTSFEAMISKVHEKQDEAWRRVKRQEEDIERRNMEIRTRKGLTGASFYSPKSRTYYSPGREIL